MDKQEGFVLVTFCKSYSKEVHICVASSGHAPEFLGMEILSDEWLMVVMEYVNGSSWDEAIDKPLAELRAAVLSLHGASFVHGDLRPNNILVMSGIVCIIDFEWAGVAGQVVYPFLMNHSDVTWPDNAKHGQSIKQAHDPRWVRSLCNQPAHL